MIKAVVFDFFGVICSDEYWRFINSLGHDTPEFTQNKNALSLGKMPWQAYVANVAKLTGRPPEEVSRMYLSENLDPRVVGLITELHKNYKTALLTNAHHEFIDGVLKGRGIDTIFDEVIVSSRVGAAKPDLKIFEYAIGKLGCEPHEILFIDDLARHTDAAEALGIKTVLFCNFDQCKQEIADILYSL